MTSIAPIFLQVFADSFGFICAGQLRSFDASGNEIQPTLRFCEQLHYCRYRAPPSSILGAAYMQGGQVGMASYHFPSLEPSSEATTDGIPYISYAAAPTGWQLDDGSAPPERKRFENPTYDADSRAFRGTIRWEPRAFGGDAVWEYEMIFAEDFRVIEDGCVHAFGIAGERRGIHRFGVHLHYELVDDESEEATGSPMRRDPEGPWVILRLQQILGLGLQQRTSR